METSAARDAERNLRANLAALRGVQARATEAIEQAPARPVEWVYGRDGELTALVDGNWADGCSVPRTAAEAILKTLDPRGVVLCFLNPTWAAQVSVALEKLRPEQAIVAVVPSTSDLWLILGSADFSAAISGHRLWWAGGEVWRDELLRIFVENPGLPTPQQFIRTQLLPEEQAKGMIAAAQEVFACATERRAKLIAEANSLWAQRGGRSGRLCAVAPSVFRLWDNDAQTLARALGDGADRLDPDDPARASGAALAAAAAQADAVVAANATRADWPAVLPADLPVVSWLTTPRIVPFAGVGRRDALVLMDETWREAALRAGWPAHRLHIGGRPAETKVAASTGAGELAIIADTLAVEPPPDFELSSHRLLWELIVAELAREPFALGRDVLAYMESRMKRFDISHTGLDRRVFIDACIVPAYQQGLARLLLGAGSPLRLWGRGWGNIDGLAKHAAGEVASSDRLRIALASCTALIHVWPIGHAHPVDATGKPIVRAYGNRRETFVGAARLALAGRLAPPDASASPVTGDMIRQIVDQR